MLTDTHIEQFIQEGFVRLDNAFPRELAEECRRILWRELPGREDEPASWTQPVVRLAAHSEPPFAAAANTPQLRAAFDALVGPERWLPGSLGGVVVRFPSPADPGDCSWHIDVSFGWENSTNFLDWRANVASKGRALLMLFLLSDTSEADAPTRIRAGSHLGIARRLAPHGDAGLSLGELASTEFSESAQLREALAIGPAGTVYLCHPFLVHSAQPHRGRVPRFLAQPPLLPRVPFDLTQRDGSESPVVRAIQLALA